MIDCLFVSNRLLVKTHSSIIIKYISYLIIVFFTILTVVRY